jgi:putative ABC transport system permease protein
VGQRTHELGIRLALGARPRDILGLVFESGGRIVALGLALGLAGSLAFARLLRTLLFNTSEADPWNLALVAVVLALVAFTACALPARRATKVDPLVALRSE